MHAGEKNEFLARSGVKWRSGDGGDLLRWDDGDPGAENIREFVQRRLAVSGVPELRV